MMFQDLPEKCPTCGSKNYPEEFAWWERNLAALAQRGDKKARKVVRISLRFVELKNRLGTLCASAEADALKAELAAAVREVMPGKDKSS